MNENADARLNSATAAGCSKKLSEEFSYCITSPSDHLTTSPGLKIFCEICDDKASGFHYGVYACEGCKGFYRRTTRLRLSYKVCNGGCKINVKTRNKCQYCRYQKCIKLGMSRNAIRIGRMSRTEKEKLMLRLVKTGTKPQESSNVVRPDGRIIELIEIVSSAFHKHISTTREKTNALWEEALNRTNPVIILTSLNDATSFYSEFSGMNLRSEVEKRICECGCKNDAQRNLNETNGFTVSHHNQNVLKSCCVSSGRTFSQLYKRYVDISRKSAKKLIEKYPFISVSFPQGGLSSIEDFESHFKTNFCAMEESLGLLIRDKQVEMVLKNIFCRGEKSGTFNDQTETNDMFSIGSSLLKFLYHSMQEWIVTIICELVRFCKCLPGFTDLPLQDQVAALKYGCYEAVFVLLSAVIFDDGLLFPRNNLFVKRDFFAQLGPVANFTLPKIDFAKKLSAFDLSDDELSLFIPVILLSGDRTQLLESSKIECMQSDMLTALQFLISTRNVKENQLFAKLLHKIADLRQLVAEHVIVSQDVVNSTDMNDNFYSIVAEIMKDKEPEASIPDGD